MPIQRRILMTGMAAAAASPALLRAQERVTLRLHQFLPPQSVVPRLAIGPWARKLEADSQGRIRVQQFPAMQLGGRPPDLFDQARDGVVDMVWTVLGYTPGRFPRSEVFELPFMCGQAEAGSQAFQEYVQTHAMDEFADVKLICVHLHGPGMFHSRTPIEKLQDVKGMRVRGGSRIINMMLEQLGAVPVGMPAPQIGEALSKGVIAAATIPWEVAPALKVHQIVKNHTFFAGSKGMCTQTFAMLMNKSSYGKLSADLRKVIDANTGASTAALFGRAMDEGDRAGLAEAQKAKNNIIMLDAAETQRWQRAAAGVRTSWYGEVKSKGIDGEKLAAEADRLIAKYLK